MKRTMMGRYFNVIFFLRLGMFEMVMASTQPFPMVQTGVMFLIELAFVVVFCCYGGCKVGIFDNKFMLGKAVFQGFSVCIFLLMAFFYATSFRDILGSDMDLYLQFMLIGIVGLAVLMEFAYLFYAMYRALRKAWEDRKKKKLAEKLKKEKEEKEKEVEKQVDKHKEGCFEVEQAESLEFHAESEQLAESKLGKEGLSPSELELKV